MEIAVHREWPIGQAVPGVLVMPDGWDCFTLERQLVAITPGRYRVLLTPSARAERRELWSPDEKNHVLPLIDGVKGRSGLRIHALNEPAESDGCLGVGLDRGMGRIFQSRAALRDLMKKLFAVPKTQAIWITIHASGTTNTT